MHRWLAMLLCVLSVSVADRPDAATAVSGTARVIDGDTLELDGQRVRIHGIDAPEGAQLCGRVPCGAEATRHLAAMIAGREVVCRGTETDAYDRLIARCEADGQDLGEAMVSAGWARAFPRYADTYAVAEAGARAARQGFWAMGFPAPWEFRANRWQAAAVAAPRADCPIKGNISGSGRIYHTPYSRWYERTRIDPARGERWFCSEREALDAGWRPPRGQ